MQPATDDRHRNAPPQRTDQTGGIPAPCHGARMLLGLMVGVCFFCLLLVGMDQLVTGPRPEMRAGKWIARFHLSGPALWPAGTVRRHPETRHPGIDLRCCAGLEGR